MNHKSLMFGIILNIVFATSCIQQLNLYDSESVNGIPESSVYLYPFNDESQNSIAEVTIVTNKHIQNKIEATIPHLKFNKELLCLLTQDDCQHSSYSYTWASINGKPQTKSYFYDVQHLNIGDLPPDTFSFHKSLGCTDGAGNEIRFAFTIALFQENTHLNDLPSIKKGYTKDYFRFYMKKTLTWSDTKDMLNYGEAIAFHNGNDSLWNLNEDSIIKHYAIGEDSIMKHLSNRGCKMLCEPDGNIHYTNAALKFPYIQTLTAQSNANTTLYPYNVEEDLKENIIHREFYNDPNDIKLAINNAIALPKESRPAICVGVHRTYNDFSNLLLWINNTYGKDGNDGIWIPSQEEYYEYCYYRNHSIISEAINGDTIKLKISMPSNKFFYYPSLTMNLSGIKICDIKNISSNEVVTGLSYANNGEQLMININCKKYLQELAEHYLSIYLKDKTEDKYRDALYFVNMLKESEEKEKLIKELK